MVKKLVLSIELYEIKICKKEIKPTLAVRTYELSEKLKGLNKKLNFILVRSEGSLKIKFDVQNLVSDNFEIRTHYGREKRQLKLKAN